MSSSEAALYQRWMNRCVQQPDHNVSTIEAEYQRLKTKFRRAMVCAASYKWSKARCVQQLVDVEAGLVTTPLAQQQDTAVRLVLAAVQAGWTAAEKKLKKVMLIVTQHQLQLEPLRVWSCGLEAARCAQFARLSSKFSVASKTAKKYGWDTRKCLKCLSDAEKVMLREAIPESEQQTTGVFWLIVH